jgi:undecaprenyl diphosphate synthase
MSPSSWTATAAGPPTAAGRGWSAIAAAPSASKRSSAPPPTWASSWLTLYAFSTENWKRSTEEVLGLMAIFARYIQREADEMAREGVRMRFIGDRSGWRPSCSA